MVIKVDNQRRKYSLHLYSRLFALQYTIRVSVLTLKVHWVPLTTSNKMPKETARYKWVLVVVISFLTLQSVIVMQRNLLNVTGCLL